MAKLVNQLFQRNHPIMAVLLAVATEPLVGSTERSSFIVHREGISFYEGLDNRTFGPLGPPLGLGAGQVGLGEAGLLIAMGDVRGKTVIVTGATHGIGKCGLVPRCARLPGFQLAV